MKVLAILLLLTTAAVAGDLPDPTKTPGAVDPSLTKDVICAPHWSTKKVRNVSVKEKNTVYKAYGIDPKANPCPCEIDHLISLEIGGSNDPKNLWPQSYTTTPWNAHVKDELENRLHRMVCSGQITLDDAQTKIRTNWITTFQTLKERTQ